jgi:hypothetical protein
MQLRLIEKILCSMNLDNCNGCDTSASTDPLDHNVDGPSFKEEWLYGLVVGMTMYLANSTRPEIAYTVHEAARFTRQPCQSHAIGVNRLQDTKAVPRTKVCDFVRNLSFKLWKDKFVLK